MALDKKYFANKKREQRARDKVIQTYHAWERMPFETNEEFKKRCSKRIVIITENEDIVILDPFGKVVSS